MQYHLLDLLFRFIVLLCMIDCYLFWTMGMSSPMDSQNDFHHCEDIHHGEFQQCHEPTGNSFSTKSMQGHSTRPLRKVTFSQSWPTMIRPDLNNFLA